jgi:hypothetical protein
MKKTRRKKSRDTVPLRTLISGGDRGDGKSGGHASYPEHPHAGLPEVHNAADQFHKYLGNHFPAGNVYS